MMRARSPCPSPARKPSWVSYRFRDLGEPLRTVVAPDGRTVAFAVWGDPDGFPVLGLHGTPGWRLNRWPDEDLYRRLGVCLVTHDRAGYGRSDRRYGRRVADEADDRTLRTRAGTKPLGLGDLIG